MENEASRKTEICGGGFRVRLRKVGSPPALPPLPTGGAKFGEDMTVGRGGHIALFGPLTPALAW